MTLVFTTAPFPLGHHLSPCLCSVSSQPPNGTTSWKLWRILRKYAMYGTWTVFCWKSTFPNKVFRMVLFQNLKPQPELQVWWWWDAANKIILDPPSGAHINNSPASCYKMHPKHRAAGCCEETRLISLAPCTGSTKFDIQLNLSVPYLRPGGRVTGRLSKSIKSLISNKFNNDHGECY